MDYNIENIGLDSADKIMSIEQPEFKNLDYKESLWMKRLNAKINLKQIIIKQFMKI